MNTLSMKTNLFPTRLKELRKRKNWTQTELGEKIGVKQNTYTNWENGKREPNLENIIKLAHVLETTTDELLGRTMYAQIDWVPFKKLSLTNLKEFDKNQLDTFKHSVAVEYVQGENLFELKDWAENKWNLDYEDRKILNTVFYEVQKYWRVK